MNTYILQNTMHAKMFQLMIFEALLTVILNYWKMYENELARHKIYNNKLASTHISQMDLPILINRTSPFPI